MIDSIIFKCSSCGYALLDEGRCRRVNSKGVRFCPGHGVPVPLFRAMCRCTVWTVVRSQLGQRCHACHRKILLDERAPEDQNDPPGRDRPDADQVDRSSYQEDFSFTSV